ncbi:mCG145634, partial [Mus musculus]
IYAPSAYRSSNHDVLVMLVKNGSLIPIPDLGLQHVLEPGPLAPADAVTKFLNRMQKCFS